MNAGQDLAWRRRFPNAELLEVLDAFAALVADRTSDQVLAHLNKPKTERLTYSPDEAAEALGVGVATIRRHIKDGTIATGKLGGRVLIHRSELERVATGRPIGG